MTPTFLQIDFQNLFFEARNKGERIDFEKVLNYFQNRETEFLIDAMVYMIREKDFNNEKFEIKLQKIGFNLKVKDVSKVTRGDRTFYRHISHDILLTLDCIEKLDMFEKWIFMSGDGDFVELCKYLRKKGKKVEIWSFENSYSRILEPYADRIYFINEKFFYKKPKIKIFGPSWAPDRNKNEKY